METKIEFTRINNDVNGNPRYVCHFLNLNTKYENSNKFWDDNKHILNVIGLKYSIACKRANKIGGRKYHNKSYGGGIVFQSYNLKDTENSIFEIIAKDEQTQNE